jgi:hypothetical protein
MDRERLREQLEQLHAELQRVDAPDENEKMMLQRLASDIQTLLERGGAEPEHYRGLAGRLRESIAELEAAHPGTTLLMRQVIDQLSFMGI